MATDLWAHLSDLPLKGVVNRSLTERWRKWRHRKPHLLSLYGMCAAVAIAATALTRSMLPKPLSGLPAAALTMITASARPVETACTARFSPAEVIAAPIELDA